MESLRDLFSFAVRIEENGRRFYELAWEAAGSEELRVLFRYLADEEIAHAAKFEKLRSETPDAVPDSAQALDHFAFLRAFINNVVFSPEAKAELPDLTSPAAVIKFALARESESILYYEELKRLFSLPVQGVLDEIVREETGHYLKLSKLQEMF